MYKILIFKYLKQKSAYSIDYCMRAWQLFVERINDAV